MRKTFKIELIVTEDVDTRHYSFKTKTKLPEDLLSMGMFFTVMWKK